jgi:hypothetical protein
MPTEKQIGEIWTDVLDDVLTYCVPEQVRERVLSALVGLEVKRRNGPRFRCITGAELAKMPVNKNYHAEKEATSLIIQVLTRSITNYFSKEEGAKILFRDHYGFGTGSGWLPDYLDGLPGIRVDKKACVKISDSAGPSRLHSDDDNEETDVA